LSKISKSSYWTKQRKEQEEARKGQEEKSEISKLIYGQYHVTHPGKVESSLGWGGDGKVE
jgi:hypothetical protein